MNLVFGTMCILHKKKVFRIFGTYEINSYLCSGKNNILNQYGNNKEEKDS